MSGAIAVVPLCGICVRRDAVVQDVVDGVRLFLCQRCSTERVADPAEQDERESQRRRKRLLTAIRWNPGATFRELRTILSIPEESADELENGIYQQTISRMARDGTVVRERDIEGWHYWLPGAKR